MKSDSTHMYGRCYGAHWAGGSVLSSYAAPMKFEQVTPAQPRGRPGLSAFLELVPACAALLPAAARALRCRGGASYKQMKMVFAADEM